MPHPFPVLLALILSLTYSTLATATQTKESIIGSISPSLLSELASNRTWLDLLHYHQVGLFPQEGSQVDDPDFFISEQGSIDPKQELLATINALSNKTPNYQEYRCKFPARLHWLSSKLPANFFGNEEQQKADYFNIEKAGTATLNCPEFIKWRNEIGADGLTLIFPAAYLNSPSSMFGHTLMRIDSIVHKSELLSYSINYAANADPDDNELVFSYKGLTGGYPGVFSILPYYEKVKEYNYLESRDVWEYKLDITNAELAQFVRHAWEVKDTHFDYYFFTENCSYHLLTLLDAASERFELSKEFSTDVIPADTVRVLNDAGLIQSARFRPSMQTTLRHRMTESEAHVERAAIAMLDDLSKSPQEVLKSESLNAQEKAQALELAVSLARYRAKEDKDSAREYNRRSIKLLSARSKLGDEVSFSATPTPTTRDDEGHRSHRWMLRGGHDQTGNYLGVDLRMSYHDFLDPVSGYIPGAQLEIIHLKFKAYLDEQRAEIDEFRAIDIASFSPRDDFIRPTSWFVSTGLTHNLYQKDELMPYLKAGPGLTYGWQPSEETSLLFTSLLSTRLFTDNDIDKGFAFESGPKLNISLQMPSVSALIYWERHYKLAGARFAHQETAIGAGIPLGANTSLRALLSYQEASSETLRNQYDVSGELGLSWYF